MQVSFVPNWRLPEFATEHVGSSMKVHEQWDNGTQTAVIWSVPESDSHEALYTRWMRDAEIPTWDFFDSLPHMSQHFGLNIPCVQ